MRGLAAGGRTGIEDTFAIAGCDQVGCALGRSILHRQPAVLEAGQPGQIDRLRQHQRIGQALDRAHWMAGAFEGFDGCVQRHAATVYAQRHRSGNS